MKEWTEYGFHLVASLCKNDPIYQSLLQECATAEAEYLNAINNLSPKNRACIERYIALCDELDNRRTQIAYFCHPQK